MTLEDRVELERIIREAFNIGDSAPSGRTERFGITVPAILQYCHGYIVEIGAGVGQSTVKFLEASREAGTLVFAVDAFEDGWDKIPESYGKPYPFAEFQKNTRGYDNLRVIKKMSQDPEVLTTLKKYGGRPAFIFIDGLQDKDSVLSDLNLAVELNATVICVDDAYRLTGDSQVPLALEEFLPQSNYRAIDTGETQELYLIHK